MQTCQSGKNPQVVLDAWAMIADDPERGRERLSALRRDYLLREIAEIIGTTPAEVTAALRPRLPRDFAAKMAALHSSGRTEDRIALAALAKGCIAAGWRWDDVAHALGISRQGASLLAKVEVEPEADVPPRHLPPVPEYVVPVRRRQITAVPAAEVERLRTVETAEFRRTRAGGTPPATRRAAETAVLDAAMDLSRRYNVSLPTLSHAVGLSRYTLSDVAVRHGHDVFLPAARTRRVHRR